MADLTGMDTGARMRGKQYKFRAYCWNGRNRMRKFDGVNWYNSGIARSDFTPSVASIAGSLTGTYRYYVVPVNSKHFNPLGRVVAGIPSRISAEITVNGAGVRVANIPGTHADSQVDKWYIFRNRSGYYDANLEDEVQDFYYVGSVNVGTTQYDDTTTTDDQLAGAEILRFNQAIPPTFKYGEIYGERMFGCGFDTIEDGTATAGGSTVDFTGVSIPDGVVGCWFQKDGEATQYRITARVSSSQVTIDRAFVGTLTNGAYRIYRYPWEIYFSEFMDPEAWGPNGEAFRWKREVPGQEPITGIIPFGGSLLVFTATSIYAISGKGPNPEDIKITPDPLFNGLGAVSGDAIFRVDDEVYFLSLRGPAVLRGGAPQLIGQALDTDWLDCLTATEQALACVGGQDDYVWFCVPRPGETENSRIFRYHRSDGSWWEESGMHPKFFFLDDTDDGQQNRLFFAQGKGVYQPDYSPVTFPTGAPAAVYHNQRDMAADGDLVLTGTVTSRTATTLTDSGATFPTTNGGLEQCYVTIYNSDGTIHARRRITSNTGTQLTWSTGYGTGQGDLGNITGYTYAVGARHWLWTTRVLPPEAGATERKDMVYVDTIPDNASAKLLVVNRSSLYKFGSTTQDTSLQGSPTFKTPQHSGALGVVHTVNHQRLNYDFRLRSDYQQLEVQSLASAGPAKITAIWLKSQLEQEQERGRN